VDPTFAVSPLRINRGMAETFGPIGVVNNLIDADKLGILRQISFSWDAVNTQWNRWVVGFSQDKQRDLLEGLGMPEADWRSMAVWLIIAALSTGGAAGLFLYVRALQTRKEPIVVAYDRICRKLAKTGVVRSSQEGPLDYWNRLNAEQPTIAQSVAPLFETYVALRYSSAGADQGHVSRTRNFTWRALRFRAK
jgi:hypothetical protein